MTKIYEQLSEADDLLMGCALSVRTTAMRLALGSDSDRDDPLDTITLDTERRIAEVLDNLERVRNILCGINVNVEVKDYTLGE